MGFPYGDGLYGKGLYSRRPDWWRGKACANDGWSIGDCPPNPWAPAAPQPTAWGLMKGAKATKSVKLPIAGMSNG